MIASLRGTVISAMPPCLVLECNGVGYEVWMPMTCFASLAVGAEARIHVTLVVREDSHSMYGFLEAQDRAIFQTLIRISGIGAKSALALLSSLDASDLARAVETNDVKLLTRAPGIGRKTAERIIVELRDKTVLSDVTLETPILSQAVEALVALGFPAGQARSAMSGIDTADMDVADLVKHGLTKLSDPKTK